MSGNIVVMGATGGIGSELARRWVARGGRVMLAARGEDRLQALSGELDMPSQPVDATDPASVAELFTAAADRLGQVHGAVNCVGSVLLKPAHLTKDEEWAETIALNLSSSFFMLRAAVKAFRNGPGSVVLLSTAAAMLGIANHEAIAAAKGGVIGLGRSAAASYAARGVRVNVVAPGLVETPLTESVTSRESSRNASLAMHALGRLGTPADVAAAIEFFLDPSHDWITGQVLGVDGGLAATKRP